MNTIEQEFEIGPEEVLLVGHWIDLGSGMVPDTGWERIDWLIANRLELVALAPAGPDALFRDPHDARLWEKTHRAPHLPNAGPPQLVNVTAEEARKKYGI